MSYLYFSIASDIKKAFSKLYPILLFTASVYIVVYLFPILTHEDKKVTKGTIIDYKVDTTVVSETYTTIEYKATIETYDSLRREYDRREYQTDRETYLNFKNKCYTKYYDVRYVYVEFFIVLVVLLILITIVLGIFMIYRIFS